MPFQLVFTQILTLVKSFTSQCMAITFLLHIKSGIGWSFLPLYGSLETLRMGIFILKMEQNPDLKLIGKESL